MRKFKSIAVAAVALPLKSPVGTTPVTVYVPGSRLPNEYDPSTSVVVVRFTALPNWSVPASVTVAPATGANCSLRKRGKAS